MLHPKDAALDQAIAVVEPDPNPTGAERGVRALVQRSGEADVIRSRAMSVRLKVCNGEVLHIVTVNLDMSLNSLCSRYLLWSVTRYIDANSGEAIVMGVLGFCA